MIKGSHHYPCDRVRWKRTAKGKGLFARRIRLLKEHSIRQSMKLKSEVFYKGGECVELLLLCVILFLNLCQGRMAVAAAVSFSVVFRCSFDRVGNRLWE